MSESLPLAFTAIDFEIANLRQRHSACSVGLAVVKDGEVAARHQWLIRPPEDVAFDEYCIQIHGITPDMVCDKPTFDELWPQVLSCLKGPLVAHNASFDMSVLRYALDRYDLCYPEFDYFCSRNLAREQWPGLISYSLDMVAHHLGIEFTHHQAVEDAYASALVVLLAARQSTLASLVELLAARGLAMGRLYRDGYEPARARRRQRANFPSYPCKPGDLTPQTEAFDEDHPFYGQVVVFTGTLQAMPRVAAWQAVVDAGGTCADTITKKANYLVVGDQDMRMLNGHEKSGKMRKAEDLCAKGCPIEVISENEFLRLLGGGA